MMTIDITCFKMWFSFMTHFLVNCGMKINNFIANFIDQFLHTTISGSNCMRTICC
jgi:hypothetical protein